MTRATPQLSVATLGRAYVRRLGMLAALACVGLAIASSASAQEELCDNSFQDCRAKIKTLIENEQVGIDVSFWFMDDWRYKDWLIAAKNRGVDVRVILDLRADGNYRGQQGDTRRVDCSRDPDSSQDDQWHQSLEDDALRRAEQECISRRPTFRTGRTATRRHTPATLTRRSTSLRRSKRSSTRS